MHGTQHETAPEHHIAAGYGAWAPYAVTLLYRFVHDTPFHDMLTENYTIQFIYGA